MIFKLIGVHQKSIKQLFSFRWLGKFQYIMTKLSSGNHLNFHRHKTFIYIYVSLSYCMFVCSIEISLRKP